ncbi:MAG: hypothetical protein Q8Q33_09605 [Chlamydiota bacterium]|nr:hypothetical protein [Chlamydiota bacterium]
MKKLVLIMIIIFNSQLYLIHAENVTKTLAPKPLQTDPTTTLDTTKINFQENPRKIDPTSSDEKNRVLDFNGNDRFGTELAPKPKPLGEISHTPAPKPRPIFDFRRKEEVETVF